MNNGYPYRFCVGGDSRSETALSLLTREFQHSDSRQWHERFHRGEITVNDRISWGQQAVSPGDIVVWNRPPWEEPETPQQFDIVFEDDCLLVVDKPSGLPTLPGGGFLDNTLLGLVRRDFPDAKPLHRLGRATSGLLMFALDSQTASIMSRQWPDVHKQYVAIASGLADQDEYDIQSPIGPVSHPRLGSVHAASETGKPSRSVARVIERRAASTVFEVDLHTGRPHQIRIHLASIGHPLVGDPLYGDGGVPIEDNPGLPGDPGYWLRAVRLAFRHPTTGVETKLSA